MSGTLLRLIVFFFANVKFLLFICLGVNACNFVIPSLSPFPHPHQVEAKKFLNSSSYFYNEKHFNFERHKIELRSHEILQIFIIGSGFIFLLWHAYLQLCNHVRYVKFNTNLNLFCKKKISLHRPYAYGLFYLLLC